MFAFHHQPESGGRGPTRPDRHFRFEKAESLESRRSQSVVGLTEAVGFAPSSDPSGFRGVLVAGTVLANGPAAPTANALLFDETLPDTPEVFAVPLAGLGDGRYSYDLPLSLSSKGANGHAGHVYGVAITVRDSGGTAGTSTTFEVSEPAPAHAPARVAKPRPAGEARRK